MVRKTEYVEVNLETRNTTPEEIISRELDSLILERMEKTIESEAPIKQSLLFKRVINSLSLEKIGSRILPVFLDIASQLRFRKTEDEGETVFHIDVEDYFRPTPESKVRYSYQIPFLEGANCILYILENSDKNTFSKSDLKKRFLEEFDYQKCGAQVEILFTQSLKDERIEITGNGRIKKK